MEGNCRLENTKLAINHLNDCSFKTNTLGTAMQIFGYTLLLYQGEGVVEVRLSTKEEEREVTTDMSTASLRSLQEGISREGEPDDDAWMGRGAPKKAESLGGGVRRADS